MKPDTDAIRQALKSAPLEPYELTALRVNDVIDLCDAFDAQTEEIKRFREALDHIANDKETPSQPWMEYLHLKRIAREALKLNTEEGHWDCICTNPTPSSPSVEGKRKCLFCAREMVYCTEETKT